MTTTLTSIPPVAALKPRKSLVDLRKEFSDFLDEELIGQPKVKKLALRIFSQIYNPMRDPNKPIFSAILAGESRTGKTLLVKLFAKWFHGREDAMVRIDGGEFLDKHYISRAIGAPPSYVGYKNPNDDDPKNALKPEDKDPSALLSQHNLNRSKLGSEHDIIFLLLDEFEKFPQEIVSILLKGLDDGQTMLANNSEINLRNVVIFFTANLGMREMANKIWGFSQTPKQDVVVEAVEGAYKQFTTPEFRNRVDAMMIYESLDRDSLKKIVQVEARRLNKFITETATLPLFEIVVSDEAADCILNRTFKGEGNLGNLKRILQELVREPAGEMVLSGEIKSGYRLDVTVENEELKLTPVPNGMSIAEMIARRGSKVVEPVSFYRATVRTADPNVVLPNTTKIVGLLAEANVTVSGTEMAKDGTTYYARIYFEATATVVEKLEAGLINKPVTFDKLKEKVDNFLVFISLENEANLKNSRKAEFDKLLAEAEARITKTGGVTDRKDMVHYQLTGPVSKVEAIARRLSALGFQYFRVRSHDE